MSREEFPLKRGCSAKQTVDIIFLSKNDRVEIEEEKRSDTHSGDPLPALVTIDVLFSGLT